MDDDLDTVFGVLRSMTLEAVDEDELDDQLIAARVLSKVKERVRPDTALAGSRRWSVWAKVGGVAAAGLLVAAWAVVRAEHTTNPSRPRCYRQANPTGDFLMISAGSDPVAGCRSAWSASYRSPAPADLVMCVDGRGNIAVLPGKSGDCDRVGWSEYAGQTAEDRSVIALQERLDAADNPCLDRDAALRLVRTELTTLHLQGWTIDDQSEGAGCVAVNMYAPAKLVYLLGGLLSVQVPPAS